MIAAIAHFQQGNFDFRGISFRRVNSPFVSPGSSHLSFLSDGSTSRILGNKEKQKLPNKLWSNQRILRFGFVIPRSSGPSGSSDTANESSSQAKAPFGYTRKDVLLIGLGVTVFGVALKSGLEFAGVDPLQAGNVVQLLVVLGMTIGWISTYMFRVANKDMTYAQQLRDYENKVMEKRLEGLTEAELQVLLEQVEEEKRHGSSRGKLGKAGIGGILRDHRGDYHCLFAKPVGIKDSNEAEFIAIVHALELSKEKSWIKEKNLIVESDSKAAAAWASSENLCPWGLRFEWNRLKCLEKLFRRVTFTYQRREPNDS